MNLPAGVVATVVVGDAQTTANLNPSDVMNAVAAELSSEGYSVLATSSSGGLLSTVTPLIQESFQATYKIQVPYAVDTATLAAAVAQAHVDVTGLVSSVITIPSYTDASGNAVSTGLAAATPTTLQGITGGIGSFFSSISSGTQTILFVVVALVVLILILAAYGPNVGHIAAAI